MPRPDGRIEKGQRLSSAISARAWNRAQQAADIVLGVQPGMTAGEGVGVERASNVVLIQNNTNFNVPIFGVLGITGVAIDPSDGTIDGTNDAARRAREFASRPVLTGAHPTSNISIGEKIAIAMEPIAAGKIGRAAVSGCFPCRVYIKNASHGFAGPQRPDDSTLYPNGTAWDLYSADCGPVQLLWKESGMIKIGWAVGLM